MKNKLLEAAIVLNESGLKVIPTNDPTRPDGKKPLVSWKQFQAGQTKQQLINAFKAPKSAGIAVLTGAGMETIDIDLKYAKTGDFLSRLLDALILGVGLDCYNKLILTKTISGGYHLSYLTDVSEGNKKLASRYTTKDEQKNEHDKTRVLIETRGEGGYILAPPSVGYAYDNPAKNYTQLQKITNNQRNTIINICKSFDETNEYFKHKAPTPPQITGGHKTTIEAFNEAHEAPEFLEAAGWVLKYSRGKNDYYVRPGKRLAEGIGAGYNSELKLLYVFTSSTEFDPGRAYNTFQVYAQLNHGGDYSAAAKDLYNLGFGDRLSRNRDTFNDKLNAITSGDKAAKDKAINAPLMDQIFNTRFSIKNVPPAIEYNLFCNDILTGELIPFASFGDIVTIVGAAKSRKSAIANTIAAALLQNDENNTILNFSGTSGGRNIVILDTEQNAPDFYKSQKQILLQAGYKNDPKNLFSFCLTNINLTDRLAFVEYVVNKVGNVGALIIDGIVDICEDYNDQKGSRKLLDHLKVIISKNNTLLIPVLHNARSTGSARGHLGTELINKSKAVIKVKKDEETGSSTVNFEYIRGAREPKNFDFTHDANGNLTLDI